MCFLMAPGQGLFPPLSPGLVGSHLALWVPGSLSYQKPVSLDLGNNGAHL